MIITVRNKASLPNKYIRFIKWKMYRLQRKFGSLHYIDLFIDSEGSNRPEYQVKLRLGITGNDIILKHRSYNLDSLLASTHKDAHRYLAKLSRASI